MESRIIVTRKAGAIAVATLLGVTCAFNQSQDVPTRVENLEGRVAKLEAFHHQPAAAPVTETKPKAGEFLAPVTITNKRYQPLNARTGIHQDAVWWDTRYNFSALKKKARAIKGMLDFRDLFGAPKFSINVTINEEVPAGGEHESKGIGFNYNQFRDSHVWVRSTDVKDMQVVFRVKQVIYTDGERAEFK